MSERLAEADLEELDQVTGGAIPIALAVGGISLALAAIAYLGRSAADSCRARGGQVIMVGGGPRCLERRP